MMSTFTLPPLSVRGHVPALDGVRGLAILMVIGSHAFLSNSARSGTIWLWIGEALRYGQFGVDLFFVLSGFLITGILVDSLDEEGFFKKFYVRRVLRIFPLYYGVLLVLFVLTPWLHLQWHGMGWLLLGYLQNFRPNQIVTYGPGFGVALNHFWSLAIEEQFYMVWPAIVFIVRDRHRLLLTTLGVSACALVLRLVLIGVGVGSNLIHVTTVTRADSLLLGGTLALLCRSRYWRAVQMWAGRGLAAAASLVVFSIFLLPAEFTDLPITALRDRLWLEGLRYTVLAFGSACLIALSLRPGSWGTWVFERKWLRFLGRYSYGIYVLHMIPLGYLLTTQRPAILRVTHSKAIAVAGAGISSLTLAIVAAYVCFHIYEKPFLRMKRFFEYEPKRIQMVPVSVPGGRRAALNLVDSESHKSKVSLR